jgi:hypothetical protein
MVEVEHLPQLGHLDAQQADLLVESQHLEHLGQIYARKITS